MTPATGAKTCNECGTGIKTCTKGADGVNTAVTACKSGYGLKTPATGLKTCEDLSTLSVKGCLEATIDSAGAVTCSACGADGYSTAAPASNACSACTATNCGVCGATAAGACTKCKKGFYNKAAAGATFDCQPCAEGCETCPDGADGATKCQTVLKGWKLSAAAPAAPTKCGGDGKTSTSATSTACDVACPTNCDTCNTDSTKCDVCKPDFEVDAAGTTPCVALTDATRHKTCKTAA